MDRLLKAIPKNPFHLLWLVVGGSVLFSALMNTVQSLIWYGKVSPDLLIIGTIDALVVSLIVSPIIIYLVIAVRKKVEVESLRQSEERYSSIIAALDEGIIFQDADGSIRTFNLSAERILGLTVDQMRERTSLDPGWQAIHEDGPPFSVDTHPSTLALSTGKTQSGVTMGVRKPDGTLTWISINSRPLFHEGEDRPYAVVTSFTDITERKKAEEALMEEKTFIEHALSTLHDIFFVFDLEGRFLRWNKTMNTVTHYSDSEISVMKPTDFFSGEDIKRLGETFQMVLKEGHGNLESRIVTKDGRQIPYDLTVSILKNREGTPIGMSGLGRDISEHKRLEGQLRQAQKMEAVGQLAGGIAHDFNNILSAIVGYGSLLHMKMAGDDPLKTYVEQILEASERATHVTHSLLAFSRKQLISLKPVNVNEILLRVDKFLKRLIGEDIELQATLTDKELTVMADSGQLEQILINLATNARDAMPKGGRLTISSKLTEIDELFIKSHAYGELGTYALVSIADTGAGMDHKTAEKIFEPFFTTKELGRGTGLGLAIVYGIVKQHNGYINVSSEPDKGTTFNIYIPVISAASRREKSAVPPPSPPLKGGTETILLAEDDEALKKLSETVLKTYGYRAIMAEDGEDAVKKFMENKEQIQLVILDMIMPKKSGKEAYDEIRKIKPGIKTLFISGYTADKVQNGGPTGEGIELMLKPVSPKDLLRKVREVLDR